MPDRPSYSFQAAGASAAAPPVSTRVQRQPGPDDHLVIPEVTRDQLIGGRLVVKMPAGVPHATKHTRLDYVLSAKVIPGYVVMSDLLTRVDMDSDFASDAAIVRDGVDPTTQSRYLEEIAFEVVSTQGRKNATEKARRMHARGVRRLFAIFVKSGAVAEWSAVDDRWQTLAGSDSIADPCLIESVEVAALLDAGMADNAVASALVAKRNPVIERVRAEESARGRAEGEVRGREEGEARGRAEGEARGRAEGEARGRAEGEARGRALAQSAILMMLSARGLVPSEDLVRTIHNTADAEILERWLQRACVATSIDEMLPRS